MEKMRISKTPDIRNTYMSIACRIQTSENNNKKNDKKNKNMANKRLASISDVMPTEHLSMPEQVTLSILGNTLTLIGQPLITTSSQ